MENTTVATTDAPEFDEDVSIQNLVIFGAAVGITAVAATKIIKFASRQFTIWNTQRALENWRKSQETIDTDATEKE